MKRKLIAGAIAIALTGCGVNEIPEESDIKKSLEEQFSGCKYVKFSDVQKLNGQELNSGRYSVIQKYTLEVLPLSGYTAELEKIEKDKAKVMEIEGAVKAEITERRNKIKSELQKLDSDFDAVAKAHYEKLEKLRSMQVSDDEIDVEKASFKEAELKRLTRLEELNDTLSKLDYTYTSELVPKLAEAGFTEGEHTSFHLDKSLDELRRRAIQEINSECKNMPQAGFSRVMQVTGVGSSQMSALTKGKSAELTETVTYMKTEKGWIR